MGQGSAPTPHLGVLHGRPSTFLERGVCIPFTTPLLSQARLRLDRHQQLECLLPGFSGGKGTYVFAWKSVPEVFRVTLHDRALHREILAQKSASPDGIRKASLEVATRGFAGIAAALQAQELQKQDQQYVVMTNYVLVLDLLEKAGLRAPDLLRSALSAEEARAVARSALTRIAEGLKMTADSLYARVESLSADMASVGLAQAPAPGRLREVMSRLQWFCEDVGRWSASEPTEASSLAKFLVDVGQQTLALARTRLGQLDALMVQTRKVLVEEAARAEVLNQVSMLSWLLDGWEYIIQLWQDALEQSEDVQRQTVCELFRIAPVVPMEELASNENVDMEELRKVQRRWVRGNQDWRTGGLDYDAVRRIETVKAKLA